MKSRSLKRRYVVLALLLGVLRFYGFSMEPLALYSVSFTKEIWTHSMSTQNWNFIPLSVNESNWNEEKKSFWLGYTTENSLVNVVDIVAVSNGTTGKGDVAPLESADMRDLVALVNDYSELCAQQAAAIKKLNTEVAHYRHTELVWKYIGGVSISVSVAAILCTCIVCYVK